MRYLLIATPLLVLFLSTCGSQPSKTDSIATKTAEEIQVLDNIDELITLRTSLSEKLLNKKQTENESDFALLSKIDDRIIFLQKSNLETKLNENRLNDDSQYKHLVPLTALTQLSSTLENSAGIKEDKWSVLHAIVEKESKDTLQTIANLSTEAESASDGEKRIKLYQRIYSLSGDDQWQQKITSEVEQLLASIREASNEEHFDEELQSKVALVKEARKGDASLVDELVGIDAKIYAKKYFDFLADGDADNAYKTLSTLSKSEDFSAVLGKLKPSSQKMAEYFTALAEQSVEKPENLKQSYRWYQQASEVRKILGLNKHVNQTPHKLITQLDEKYQQLKDKNEQAAALAVLYAIQGFKPTKLGLRKAISQQEKLVLNVALPHLSTTDFESRYRDQDYGDVITAFITQYLFEHIPNDVRIVEREQYEAIMRERQLSGNNSVLSSVDLLVSGSVLESKVDSSEAKNKKLMRVAVGKETVPNPAYIEWLKMSTKDREKVAQPTETIAIDKQENISVGITRHRKVGIFSVSYRLVEAESGQVVLPDSITLSKEYEDESSEGVEMGDVVIPFKLADLPSDVKILDQLAKEAATKIGEHLVSTLENQEAKYLAKAETAANQNDCVNEVESLANALMIMQKKQMSPVDVKPRFTDIALACY